MRGPYTRMERLAWAMAAVGERFFVSDRLYRYVTEHSGFGIWNPDLGVYLNHHEGMFDVGYGGAFGSQRSAWVEMQIDNWMGDDGVLWKLRTEHRARGGYGDVYWCHSEVVEKRQDDDGSSVQLACRVVNQSGLEVLRGKASVILPSRHHGAAAYPRPISTAASNSRAT